MHPRRPLTAEQRIAILAAVAEGRQIEPTLRTLGLRPNKLHAERRNDPAFEAAFLAAAARAPQRRRQAARPQNRIRPIGAAGPRGVNEGKIQACL